MSKFSDSSGTFRSGTDSRGMSLRTVLNTMVPTTTSTRGRKPAPMDNTRKAGTDPRRTHPVIAVATTAASNSGPFRRVKFINGLYSPFFIQCL